MRNEQVKAWSSEVTANLSSEQLSLLLEQVFSSLYKRSRTSLSSVMLEAILERVLFSCLENHPILAPIKVNESGFDFVEFHKASTAFDEKILQAALESMISEFIAILDRITNGVITRTLYSELSTVRYEPQLKVLNCTNGEKS
jgi:Ca2+-binding EF-hand superfamily protein